MSDRHAIALTQAGVGFWPKADTPQQPHFGKIIFLLSYTRTSVEHGDEEESPVLVLDALALVGLAAMISSLSALIWSIRRKA